MKRQRLRGLILILRRNIHSSVSGTVKAIEPRTLATGGKCNSIIIENDGEFKEVEYTSMKFEELTKETILE